MDSKAIPDLAQVRQAHRYSARRGAGGVAAFRWQEVPVSGVGLVVQPSLAHTGDRHDRRSS